MKKLQYFLIGLTMLSAIPAASFGQNGNDINQAIPIYFGQTINDNLDSSTRQYQVYSITLAKGQQVTVTAVSNSSSLDMFLFNSGVQSIVTQLGTLANASLARSYGSTAIGFNYQVAAAGVYYVVLVATGTGIAYTLQVTAQGTPITTPNPPQAGCLTGQIDYITYSLQLIAAGLPDTASIGGTQMCATCTVKPPAYPALVQKMETAMGLAVGVSACYDATGNIFQLKLNHP